MAVPASSLSVAIQGIADFLDSQFSEEVNITVTNPQKAADIAKGAGATAHCLNLFTYRVSPSGFQADVGQDATHFIRVHALMTAFPTETADDDTDLRILGHAIRVLNSHPIIPVGGAPLPGPAIPDPKTDYRLEAIMLAPPMEEINHIWTTQGGELAYRLSAVYEFALIPIEPLTLRVEAEPPDTLIIDAHPTMNGVNEPFVPISNASVAQPTSNTPPVNWIPMQMGVNGDQLTNSLEINNASTQVTLAIVGPVDEHAALAVLWQLDDDSESTQPPEIKLIVATSFDDANAQTTVALTVPANAVSGVIRIQPATHLAAYPDAAFGNVIRLNVS
ncbi:Pvc16 family protein [Reinekea sp. G2M2-21]|uniref:Pvc16 family protein n=1 Tax=Reinekea sp. G2M2-21 TaxID=2788942 RepID=UPI0018AC73B8|nr:Pvc16 family protein [Reinekea sp. G2M2-21]